MNLNFILVEVLSAKLLRITDKDAALTQKTIDCDANKECMCKLNYVNMDEKTFRREF